MGISSPMAPSMRCSTKATFRLANFQVAGLGSKSQRGIQQRGTRSDTNKCQSRATVRIRRVGRGKSRKGRPLVDAPSCRPPAMQSKAACKLRRQLTTPFPFSSLPFSSLPLFFAVEESSFGSLENKASKVVIMVRTQR